jgi:hypothetical protein
MSSRVAILCDRQQLLAPEECKFNCSREAEK